jgi:hypothetical protein
VQHDALGEEVGVGELRAGILAVLGLFELLVVLAARADVSQNTVLEFAGVFFNLRGQEQARPSDELFFGERREVEGVCVCVGWEGGIGRGRMRTVSLLAFFSLEQARAYQTVVLLEGLNGEEAVKQHARRRHDDAVQTELLGHLLDEHNTLLP